MTMSQEVEAPELEDGQDLYDHLFEGDLIQLPEPGADRPEFLPEWFTGPLPILVYPPLSERVNERQNGEDGEEGEIPLQVTLYHFYYGALRELAESADAERSEMLRRFIQACNPQAAQQMAEVARVLHDQGAPEEAEAMLRRFLEEYPEGEDREMVEHALEYGFEMPEAPNEEQQLFSEAQALVFGGDPGKAVELLQPLAETYPDTGEIWFLLGAAHRRLEDNEEAERCLRRAARLAPGEPFVWWELGRANLAMQEWRAAEDALGKALEIDPENALFLCDLGRTRLGMGDADGARELIERARELAPDEPSVQEALQELDAPPERAGGWKTA